jgi:hypothetical protein
LVYPVNQVKIWVDENGEVIMVGDGRMV